MKTVELTEQILTRINTGQTANIVYSHTKVMFDKKVHDILSKMKFDYRAGKFDANTVQSEIATLCALEDIQNMLRSQIDRGTKALENTQGKGDSHE